MATLLEPREAAWFRGPSTLHCSALPEVEGECSLHWLEQLNFVAVKVEFATGDGFSFPFGHFGVFSWRSSQISLALTEKRSMRDGYGSQQAELTCSPCSRDVTAAIDWPCPPPPGKACWGRGMFASLAGTTEFCGCES